MMPCVTLKYGQNIESNIEIYNLGIFISPCNTIQYTSQDIYIQHNKYIQVNILKSQITTLVYEVGTYVYCTDYRIE